MVNRVFVTPSEVRGYGNIISEKTTDDFSLYQSSLVLADNVYTLSYNAGVTVSLGLSSSTVTYGTSVTLTATVLDGGSPVASGGTVTFYDGTTSLGTGTTGSDGKATLSKSDFTVGSHTLKAVYSTVNSSTVTLTVTAITVSSVTLASNKDILSYADSDSCTLSATVTGSDSNPMSGVSVEFFKGSTSLGTSTTNSSGVATKSYSSAGSGDVSFTASSGSVVSESFAIEDCSRYIPTKYTSSQSNLNYALPNGKFSVSFYIHRTNGSTNSNGGAWCTLRNNSYELLIGETGSLSGYVLLGRSIGASSFAVQEGNVNYPNDTELLVEYVFDNNTHTVKLYNGNTELVTGTTTNSNYNPTKVQELFIQSMNKVEGLKIKPL